MYLFIWAVEIETKNKETGKNLILDKYFVIFQTENSFYKPFC